MDKTKIQKVNKARIAVVVPPPQKATAATSPFTDIDQYSDHYNDILKLYSQGVIDGFLDNTFRPDVSVTRGQAAKMLATALKLDTKNVQDPYYKDVPKSSEFYRAVAALQNAGIMSGYSNSTFMPNEPITRGELAKIIVLAFHLEVSPTYNHIFKDVDSKSSNAIYIQTLIDLNITEGTTPVTFSPFEPVTRGQFASFVVGAQEKKSNETSFKITKVDEDAIYINGEAYRVSDSLAHVFNEDNAEVLKGALIEGNLSGKSLLSVSKLTLNASGTSSSFLEFDGDYGSLGASIVVNGNYIEFSNITLTGTVFVNETVRPSLRLGTTYNQPLTMGRVASLNTSFINWSNPDNEEEASSTNNPTNDLQNWTKPDAEQEKPFVNWTKEKQEMKNVEKHLIFYNSTVSRLVVSQSGTKIETNTKLPRVDINGSVQEFEIQGDIGTLNINTETKLTIYGEGNIDWINYKGNKDLELYIDGRVGTLYIENKYGKIDIGDYTYVDKVVIPKGETPNNIFDDFLEDKDNVGSITDPDGNPIDKDDIDNQQPDDKTKPTVSITELQVLNGSEIEAKFNSNEVGTYYYIVREADADAPTRREMIDRLSNQNVAHGTAAAVNGINTIHVSNLGEKKEYVIYILVVDGAKNASDIVSESFQMRDASPPVVRSLNVEELPGGTRAKFTFTASEPGDYYYYVRRTTTAPPPTTEDIIANPTGSGTARAGALVGIEEMLTGLEAETSYQLYVVMRDVSGNLSEEPATATFITLELDLVPPYVVNGELVKLDEIKNEFYITVSEALDPVSAENVENYALSGTGIVNQGGQRPIHPTQVVYNRAQNRLVFTIPSLTGFVNGDNLVVTISPNVKDLADNEFENINNIPPNNNVPRNTAEYVHNDPVGPILTIKDDPIINNTKDQTLLKFHASKAGTYHYLIMESGLTLTNDDRLRLIEAVQQNEREFKVGTADVAIIASGGNKPAQLGDQEVLIPLPNTTPPLDPFKSYSIYMILRDRSGNVSNIVTKHVIDDRTPPNITNTSLTIKEGDREATFKFISDEELGSYHYILRRKGDTTVPAPISAEEIIGRGTTSTLRKGINEIRLSLEPHQEYELYVAVQDRYHNATMLQIGNESKIYTHDEQQQKTITLTPSLNNTGIMRYEFFSDGTPPRVEDPIVKQLDGRTFEVTFSEAVDITNSNFRLVDPVTGNAITPTYASWKWEDEVDEKDSWRPRKMILTFANEVTRSFDLTVNASVTDNGGWTFSKPKAQYQYPTKVNTITSATLTPDTQFPSNLNISKEVLVVAQLNADITWDQHYYYAVLSEGYALTLDNVRDVIERADNNNFSYIPGGAIISYGKGQITGPSDVSFAKSFIAIQTSTNPNSTNVFQKDQRIYLFTKDKYGNIIYAKESTAPTAPNYVLIQPRTQ